MNRIRVRTAFAGVASLVLTGSALFAQASDGHWIIRPGEGIGPIEIGMHPDAVTSAVGQPDERVGEGGSWWTYRKPGVHVAFPLPGQTSDWVVELRLSDRVAARVPPRTAEGIGLGSSKEDVIAVFGPPNTRYDYGTTIVFDYESRGILFAMREDRVVELIVSQAHRKAAPKSSAAPRS